ncbi:Hypothetical predicted protein [Mytilus galloprovincialis]|uniref:Uncharacterized protein n=1 Tax=Mytilus galloprovincialis TaxID=29158 RepID=A0A8B6FQP2_MYTGA|nr:Hypothetical predicted protein [Mytilus galloprovincialis]
MKVHYFATFAKIETSISQQKNTVKRLFAETVETIIRYQNCQNHIIHKINVDCNGITGCAMSEAGIMLILQAYQNSLLKYGPDGQFHSKSRMNPDRDCSYIGFDIAVIDSHTAVVSSGRRYPSHIEFIDMGNGKFLRVLKNKLLLLCFKLS